MQKGIVFAVVRDGDGFEQCVHPGKVIPIEYARCTGLVRNLGKVANWEQKEAFLGYLILRLNTKPWWAFDEMFSSVRSPTGAPIVCLQFEEHEVDYSTYSYPNPLHVHSRRPILP